MSLLSADTRALLNGYRPPPPLVVVTASTSAERLEHFADVVRLTAADRSDPPPVVAVLQTAKTSPRVYSGLIARSADYMGVVPAFAYGVHLARIAYPLTEVIAVLHDDCILQEEGWDRTVVEHFATHERCGLAGFGGAWGLGDEQAGQGDYRPTWLVRRGFMSNMKDAEVHGTRVTTARKIAVLDGFSLIFRRRFLNGLPLSPVPDVYIPTLLTRGLDLFSLLQSWGVVHHVYDAAMGAFARQLGWETWLLPVQCWHMGGQTAVGDAGYNEWARQQTATGEGDQRFWEEAHGIVWVKLGHLLPFEVDRP